MGHCLAALAVILSFMADTKHVVLIHGSWSRGEQLAPARTAFEERGYTAHTPTLRHHELPMQEGAMKIASLSLRDYTDDLVTFVNSLDCPPLLIGHSTGGLLAQLVAARTRHAGLVAACPAPAGGIPRYDPHKLAHVAPVVLTATPLGQAGASPDVGAVSTVDRQHPDRGHRARDIRRFGLRIRAGELRDAPCGGKAFQSHRCRLRGGHQPGAGGGRRVRPHCASRSRASDRSPISARHLPRNSPVRPHWCFQGRRCP
jgi:pimeloyl-ACP methyl ester carboxylesterase